MTDLPADADVALVERARLGDHRAFGMLAVKYQRRVERLIGRMIRDPDRVRDLVQDTFLSAYRALPKFRGDSAFYTWLYRIAVNTAKKALADMRRDPLVFESALSTDDDETDGTFRSEREPMTTETPEAMLASRQVGQAVEQAVAQLPADLRQALLLREMEGLSYEEIAALMNCPVGTVRSRIFRAREAVSQQLEPLLERRPSRRW
jgi:RNA polymerase sigma-70 factor (ECF subfamily)